MRLLVFGKTGQVAREMARRCPPEIKARFLGREAADLRNPDSCVKMVRDCDVVVNAAAWTAVDRAEDGEAEATVVNGDSPGAIARAVAARGLAMLQLSTDFVLGGQGAEPQSLQTPPAPLNAYGRSKLKGEEAVLASGAKALIVRTSWVFSAHGSNFLKTMLRLGQERKSLDVVADQVGGPTPASALADAIFAAARAMAGGAEGGVHHFSGAPDVSWADFAKAIMKEARLDCRIVEIPSSSYKSKARRPANSRLDCSSFVHEFGVGRPDWRRGIAEILSELGVPA
jgi:dTDP-4-dehydrorhamnose reductase